jgi:hypothetical protein
LIPTPICSSVFPISCSCFKVSGLILRALIYFQLMFHTGWKTGI